jgi:hypothetical protein
VQCSGGTDQDDKRQTAYNTTRHDHPPVITSVSADLGNGCATPRPKVSRKHSRHVMPQIGIKKPMNVTRFLNRSVKIRPRNVSVSIPFRLLAPAGSPHRLKDAVRQVCTSRDVPAVTGRLVKCQRTRLPLVRCVDASQIESNSVVGAEHKVPAERTCECRIFWRARALRRFTATSRSNRVSALAPRHFGLDRRVCLLRAA